MAASGSSGQESTTPRRGSLPIFTSSQQTKEKERWSHMDNELASMKTRIDKVELQLSNFRERLSSQTDDEESARNKAALAESQDAVELIKRQLNKAMTSLRQREALLTKREVELQATQRQVDNLTKQRAADQKELSRFKNLVEELKKQLTERENKIEALERELKKTRYDLDVTRKDLKDTNKSLKSHQEELKATKKDLKNTKEATRDELKRTNAELSSMKDMVSKLAEDMKGIKHAACSEDLAEAARGTQKQDSLPLRQQHQQHPAQLQPSRSQSIGADKAVSNQSLSLPPILYNFPPSP